MKRRITIEQLQELTPEQQQKLRQQWKPEEGDFAYNPNSGNDYIITYADDDDGELYCEDLISIGNYQEFLPLLDIGQMLILLESKYPTLHIDKHLPAGLRKEDEYEVFQQGAGSFYGESLCDALWEAIKATLKREVL